MLVLERVRRIIQTIAIFMFNPYLLGFKVLATKGNVEAGGIYTGVTKGVCMPGMNCYSCPAAAGACPIGSLQAWFKEASSRASMGEPILFTGFYIVGFILLIGSICGRLMCGWVCPFGFFQDLIYKIPVFKLTPKRVKTFMEKVFASRAKQVIRVGNFALGSIKYMIVLLFVIILPLIYLNPHFCKYICPIGTLEAGIPIVGFDAGLRASAGGLFIFKLLFLAVCLIMMMMVERFFCRYICPLGAFWSIFNKSSIFRLSCSEDKCISCGLCQKVCPTNCAVYKVENSTDCIRCLKCIDSCPTQAISFGIAKNINKKVADKKPKSSDTIFAIKLFSLATTIVVVTLFVFPALNDKYNKSTPKTGAKIKGFEMVNLQAGSVTNYLAKYKDTPLIVNFWATSCGPCKEEMPDFVKLQTKYREQGVKFVGITTEKIKNKSSIDYIEKIAASLGINYPIIYNAPRKNDLLTVTAIPVTIFFDKGEKVLIIKNKREYKFFQDKIEKLLAGKLKAKGVTTTPKPKTITITKTVDLNNAQKISFDDKSLNMNFYINLDKQNKTGTITFEYSPKEHFHLYTKDFPSLLQCSKLENISVAKPKQEVNTVNLESKQKNRLQINFKYTDKFEQAKMSINFEYQSCNESSCFIGEAKFELKEGKLTYIKPDDNANDFGFGSF